MNILQTKKTFCSDTVLWSSCCALFCLYAIWLSCYGINDWSIRTQERFWNKMGFISIILAIGSVIFWLSKKKIAKVKEVKSGLTILHLRESHIALGWISFAIGLGHSIFFIVNDLGRPSRNFTGYIALIIMLLVILSGAMYKHKVLKVSVIKQWHLVIACVLVGIMLVHI
ncbi:hypothetical protein [Desulfosporosinus sp. Sb-LF]|uniref:hypothetical protein n=1 Tax=Desulfosporosinus sp. Sb-LF TaxID=2560027 RepID=UPI0011042D33|nr:hypothetical protein [Desulfosporosinus sp. Sb-LF]TGE31792.1 hypothetical protein E4K68_15450 [Desulfosporosinus sp. Sb-LF]